MNKRYADPGKTTALNHLSYSAREKLFNSCIKLAYAEAAKFNRMGSSHLQDFQQAALIGLWDAAMTFRSVRAGHETKFITHAQWRIYGALMKHLDYLNHIRCEIPTDTQPERREGVNYADLPTVFETKSASPADHQVEAIDEAKKVLSWLKPKQRKVVILRYWHQMTYREIAKEMKCTKECVRQMLDRAFREFRIRGGLEE